MYYSVIVPVYNVELYLEDFFISITNQTLDFEKYIYLIIVDDGSTDSSARIIEKWRKKYPGNIKYLYKENGGLSSARNFGLEHVISKWVTFIDPDDFVDRRYFEEIQRFEKDNADKNFSLLSCHLIFFYEKNNSFADNHPLNYRFADEDRIVQSGKMENMVHLSANSGFFRSDILKESGLLFSEKVKPNFEDGHLTNLYLLYDAEHGNNYVAFLADAKYYYRKRALANSLLDTSWQNPTRYFDVLQYGYLDLLQKTHENKEVSKTAQRTVLYDLMWYFKILINNPEKTAFLNKKQKTTFIKLVKEIGKYIENETIGQFELAGCWWFYKVGLMGFLKGQELSSSMILLDRYDRELRQIRGRFFTYSKRIPQLIADGMPLELRHIKIKKNTFVGELFLYEYYFWIEIDRAKKLKASVDGKPASIVVNSIFFAGEVDVNHLKELLEHPYDITTFPAKIINKRELLQLAQHKEKFKDAWLLMDRDVQADDNAEHLYRYIARHHPEVNLFFALRKESHDWNRLEKNGFNLVDFGSPEFESLYICCRHLISSHADAYVNAYFSNYYYGDLIKYKYTFLQHGVTKDDLSGWLNRKEIDCFITTAVKEKNSIDNNETSYKFTPKEVVLTGFARHDSLLRGAGKKQRMILVMPTWREYLVGRALGKTNERALLPDFMDSQYARAWQGLLSSSRLKELLSRYQFQACFFLHANMQKYMTQFSVPEHIRVLTHKDISIQELFQQAALMITDYSSVAFEMAYLRKSVLYYQFDKEAVLDSHAHLYQKGYFDYDRDGFGPVCLDEASVLQALEALMQQECQPEDKYFERMRQFFAFHDTNNCQRIFRAIKKMEGNDLMARQELEAFENNEFSLKEELAEYKKPETPLFSVVIPCFNAGDTIENTVISVLRQTCQNFEIIIVDDASTDPLTLEKLESLQKELTVLSTKVNGGPSKAKNVGIKEAAGKYILCLDADDLLSAKYLEQALTVFENNEKVGVVSPSLQFFGASKGTWTPEESFSVNELLSVNRVPAASCVRKEIFDDVGGFDENLRSYEDWEFWIRVFTAKASWQHCVLVDKHVFYRVGEQSLQHSIKSSEITERMSYIYGKHNKLYQRAAEELFVDLHMQYTTQRLTTRKKLGQYENTITSVRQRNEEYQKKIDELQSLLVKKDEQAQNRIDELQGLLARKDEEFSALRTSESFKIGHLIVKLLKPVYRGLSFPLRRFKKLFTS